jgi:galactonate dehydratase
MKITKVETVRVKEYMRLLWVIVHTDEGITGLGETYDKVGPAKAAVHEVFSQVLIGRDPRDIEQIWYAMFQWANMHGFAGAEIRAISAIDIALWDILGKYTGQPIYRLLGGKFRDRIPLYNACDSWGSVRDGDRKVSEPGALAKDLLAAGFKGMKFNPFLWYAQKSRGQYISAEDLEEGIGKVREIRDAVGDRIEIAIDCAANWNLPAALRIGHALDPYHLMFWEEPMMADNLDGLAQLCAAIETPICESERLFTRWQFRKLMEARATHIVMPDICWAGGISETKKIAAMAESFGLPIAPHNCGGPGCFFASGHLCINVPNVMMMEAIRAFYQTFYGELVTHNVEVREGCFVPPERPGLGTELRPEVFHRPDVDIQVSDKPSDWGTSPLHKLRW